MQEREQVSYRVFYHRYPDDRQALVRVAAFPRSRFWIRAVRLNPTQPLDEWCRRHSIRHAINGGFFVRTTGMPLGDLWTDGSVQPVASVDAYWAPRRGCLYTSGQEIVIATRKQLPKTPPPASSLLMAGPLLVCDGSVVQEQSREGFSETAGQFDSDITAKRYPRSAIGLDDRRLLAVVVEGRSADSAGASLEELAGLMRGLGCQFALNLDGGGSSSMVLGGRMVNHPRGEDHGPVASRPISTAIVFEPMR